MDFLVELVVQVVVQVVLELVGELLVETAFHGLGRVLRSTVGRYVVGALVALGFGLGWGAHLSGRPHEPRLLWVSLALAVAATLLAVLAVRRGRIGRVPTDGFWADVLVPPWRWPALRLGAFAVMNVGLAAGIVLAFRPG